MTWELPDRVDIRDIGPGTGLVAEQPIAIADRVALITALVDAGVGEIEAAAVGPLRRAASGGVAELFAALERDEHVRYWATVTDVADAEAAIAAGVDGLSLAVAATEEQSQQRHRRSLADALASVGPLAELAGVRPLEVVVLDAFGTPDEPIGPFDVAAVTDAAEDSGATSITLVDGSASATPERIADVVAAVGVDVRLRLHDGRGAALACAFAAMTLGVHRFDTAIGGIGASPFAAVVAGHLATEELVDLCDGIGIDTGADLDRLVRTTRTVAALIGRPVPSRLAAAMEA